MTASKRTATSRRRPRSGLIVSIAAGAVLLASPALAGLGLEDFGAADISLGEQGILLYDYESGQQATFDDQDAWDQGTHTNTFVAPTGALELAPLGDVGPRSDIAWWDDAWASRQCVSVTNGSDPDSERPVQVAIDTAAMIANEWLTADGSDLRAVDTTTGDELPHWIASAVPSEATSIWVQLDEIPTGASSFCLYLGNPEAESTSDEFGVYTFSERTSRHYTLTDAFDGSQAESGQVRVVSYADGVVVSNGTVTTTLNQGESDTFSGMTQHSFIDATGPISAAGLGNNTDTLVPESFASTSFIFAADRNVQQYWVRSPGAASTIEIVYDNAVVATHTITPAQGSVPLSLDAAQGKSVVLRSTNGQAFLAAHDADGADSIIGVPWTGQTLYGLRSTQMQIGTGVAGATITSIGSDGGGSPGVAYGPNISTTIAPYQGEEDTDDNSETKGDDLGDNDANTDGTEPDPTAAAGDPEPTPADIPATTGPADIPATTEPKDADTPSTTEPTDTPDTTGAGLPAGAEQPTEPGTSLPPEPEQPTEPGTSVASEPATQPEQPTEPDTSLPSEPAAPPEPATQPEPATAGYAITSDNPIAVNQFDDGSGSESTTFLPLAFLDSDYLAPTSFASATFVCPRPGTIVTMTTIDGTSTSFNCSSAGDAGSPGLATTPVGEYPSGTRFASNNVFFLKIDKLGTRDDTNVLGPRVARTAASTSFSLTVGPTEGTLPATGSWTTILDTEDSGVFGLITALGTLPEGTEASIRIAGAATPELAASFIPVGPDGTAATSFEIGSTMIPYPMDFDRFVAISVILKTDADAGPSVSSLTLTHNLDLLDMDGSATAYVNRQSAPKGSTGFVARVLTNPGTPMSASINYRGGAGLGDSDQLVVRTDHPDDHVVVDGGVLTQKQGGTFTMDAASPFSILYDETTGEGATPSLTIRLQGEEPDGFTRSNDIVVSIDS